MTKKQALENEYRKARKNYQQRRRYYKKKYNIDLGEAPSKPKRITQGSINKLNKGARPTKEVLAEAKYIIKQAKAFEISTPMNPPVERADIMKERFLNDLKSFAGADKDVDYRIEQTVKAFEELEPNDIEERRKFWQNIEKQSEEFDKLAERFLYYHVNRKNFTEYIKALTSKIASSTGAELPLDFVEMYTEDDEEEYIE